MHRDRILADLGEKAGDMALRCSDAAGLLARLDQGIEQESTVLEGLTVQMDRLANNQRACDEASAELRRAADYADQILRNGHRAAEASLVDLSSLAGEVIELDQQLRAYLAIIESVSAISEQMSAIANQTRMLGINASIEAARGGAATRGFAVVADEVRRLAVDANDSAITVSDQVQLLNEGARSLIERINGNAVLAGRASGEIGQIRAAMSDTAALVSQFRQRSCDIADRTENSTQATQALSAALRQFAALSSENAALTADASGRVAALEDNANDILDETAHSGVQTRDTPYVDRALKGCRTIVDRIMAGLDRRELTPEALFDTQYRPIPGTNPVQYFTGFVEFADRHLRPMLDRLTSEDPTIFGCCLVDNNGFLPTHISLRSQPQRPGELDWNSEHARNRQFFLDSQTRRALARDGDYFVYTYRQDLGQGRYLARRSVLVPMVIGNRRWGLYELGYVI